MRWREIEKEEERQGEGEGMTELGASLSALSHAIRKLLFISNF